MPDRFVMSHLRRLPMFAALPEDQLAQLSDIVRVTRYEAGEFVFRQGQPAQGLYMFVTGRGALLQQTPAGMRNLGLVEASQYINEAALTREQLETATLQIVETAIVLFIPRKRLESLLASQPALRTSLRLPGAAPVPVSSAPAPATTPAPQAPAAAVSPSAPPAASRPRFDGQHADEKLYLMTRRHWWAYIRRAWLPLLVAALMFGSSVLLPVPELRLVMLGLTVVIPGMVMLYFYFEWHNDLLIITDQRIIRKEHMLLTFNRQVNEMPIRSVQAVNSEIPTADVFARLFNYGELVIKTAGRAGTVVFDFIPNPEGVQDIIFKRISDRSDEVRQRQTTIRGDIEKALSGGAVSSTPPPVKPKPPRPGPLQSRFVNAAGETVYRKHWLFWLNGTFLPLVVLGGGVILFLAWLFVPALNQVGIIVLPLVAVILLVGGLWFYWSDWDWRNDLYIIGNDTITLIHRRPLWLQNEDDRILINRIDNVTVEISGIFQSMFNYGDVKIALIGDASTKLFRHVPVPRTVQEEISARQTRARQAIIESEERRRQQEIASYIAAYDEARRSGIPADPYNPQSYAPPYVTPAQNSPQIPGQQPYAPSGGPAAPRPQYGTGIPGSRPHPGDLPTPDQQPPPPGGTLTPGNRPPRIPPKQ